MSEEFSFPTTGPDTPVSNEPLTVNVPSGNFGNITASGLVNFYYPFSPQTFAGSVSNGFATPTVSGNGYLGQNNNGFVFQTGQYISKREGSGN